MALILQRLRDSQPQDFAPADLSAPINQGAVEVFSFGGNGLRGAVRGYAGTVQSGAIGHSVLSVAGVGARSIAFDGATWLDFPAAVGAFGTGEFSVTVIFRATAGHLFGNNESAVAGGWLLYKSGTKLVINQNDAFSLNLSTTADVYDGALHCVTITRSSGGYYQWMVDGRLDNGSAGTLLSVSSGKSPVLGGQRNGASSAGALLNGDVAFVAMHTRAISLEDHRSYSRRPWRGLSGPRIYIPAAEAAGGGGVTGTLAATESGADTAALSGQVVVTGALAATESGADTAALSGAVIVAGALSAVEAGDDSAAAAGVVVVQGALSATDAGADTAAISGGSGVSGSLAALESGTDTAAGLGGVLVQGSLSAAEAGADTALLSGGSGVYGSIATAEDGADTAAVIGVVTVIGELAAAETAGDTLAAAGGVLVQGALVVAEVGVDTAALTSAVAVAGGVEYVRLYSRISPAVAALSPICPTVARPSLLATRRDLRSTIDLESP